VVGATGYAGAEIVRLLSGHPHARITIATSQRSAGKPLKEECPWLHTDLVLTEFSPDAIDTDFVMLCQEAGFAMEHASHLAQHSKVIDLSGDFRLRNSATYARYYGREHTVKDWKAAYGLPEAGNRDQIRDSNLVANPGCYPTAAILALMPLARARLAKTDFPAIVDAKSGVSGAGRSRQQTDYLFSELSGGFKPYNVTGHRHLPEIEQAYGAPVRFTPHLLPAARGLEATCHVALRQPADLLALYRDMYANEPFVEIQDSPPSTKQVLGSNKCVIYPAYDEHTGFAVVCSVIDNLVKGAAGQAIQNMNIMAAFPEETGLPKNGIWP
jgi:N-acetyl-gamma-glutamyl-phosphate reductase